MIALKKSHLLLLSLLAGALLGLNFLIDEPWLWLSVFICLWPALYLIHQKHLTSKQRWWCGFVAGTTYFGLTIAWKFQTLPLDWAGIENYWLSLALVTFVWLANAVIAGFLFGAWLSVAHRLKTGQATDVLTLSALWVLLEFVRAIAYTLLWSGPTTLVGPHWTVGFLGYLLADLTFLLPLAGIGGVYLLSFTVVMINILTYQLFFTSNYTYRKTTTLTIIVILILIVGAINLKNNSEDSAPTLTVGIATNQKRPGRSPSAENVNFDFLRQALKRAEQKNEPLVLIFPEDTRLISLLEQSLNPEDRKLKSELATRENILVIDSERTLENNLIKEKIIYSHLGSDLGQNEKILLVPHGEYLPYFTRALAFILRQQKAMNYFDERRSLAASQNLEVGHFRDFTIGGLFCSEIMSPDLHRLLTARGANLLVNVSSHGLFHGSKILYHQTVQMAKVRAVENNRYFIQSSLMVPSFIINHRGEMIYESAWHQDQLDYVVISANETPSFYTQYRDWILLLSLLIITASTTIKFKLVRK